MENSATKKIWLFSDYETTPYDTDNQLRRVGILADYLVKRGYDVTWWTTGFFHPQKKQRFDGDKCIEFAENYRINYLYSPIVYKKNMSPMRMIYYRILAGKLNKRIRKETERPDLILSAYPTEGFCRVAMQYGRKYNIPVIMDARDLWPDIFERALPGFLQPMAAFILKPLKHRAAKTFAGATALCGMSPVSLDWALNYAGREQNALDRYIYIGCTKKEIPDTAMQDNLAKWSELGITKDTWNVCLFSSLSSAAQDIDTVVDAMQSIYEKYPQIRFIIGGKGDAEEPLRERSKSLKFLHVMGWMNAEQMGSLMSISKIGMLCYRNTPDYRNAWGNKVGQYLSYGLPVWTSTEGIAKAYMEKWNCGLAYKEGDVQGVADLLAEYIDHPEKLEIMSGNAEKRYNADFMDEVVARKFEEMILEVCGKYNDLINEC